MLGTPCRGRWPWRARRRTRSSPCTPGTSRSSPGYEAGAVDPTEAEASARDFVRAMVAEHDEGRVDARIADGPAGRALVDAAETLGPDLVVVVGHGGSGKTSLLLGSTAHHLVHHAHAPVVVVRGELRIPVRRLVVGVDGSDHDRGPDDALDGRAALGAAPARRDPCRRLARRLRAGGGRRPGARARAGVGPRRRAEDDSRLRRAIDEATDGTGVAPNGAEILPVVAAGTGAFAMIEASRDADLVVIGTRGRSGLLELIVGSTTLEVLAHAHCPVAVVR